MTENEETVQIMGFDHVIKIVVSPHGQYFSIETKIVSGIRWLERGVHVKAIYNITTRPDSQKSSAKPVLMRFLDGVKNAGEIEGEFQFEETVAWVMIAPKKKK